MRTRWEGKFGRLLLAAAVAVSATMLGAPTTGAQQLKEPPAPGKEVMPKPRDIKLNDEQRRIVKDLIINQMKIKPPTDQAKVPGSVGETVPSGVPLQPIPVEVVVKIPELKAHSYVVKDDAILIVDPKDNRVADLVR